VTTYRYDGANTVQELTGASVTASILTGLGVDEIFQRTEGATTRSFITDALGSTLGLADSAGAIQTTYSYAPYGDTTFTGTAANNRSDFTGRENDSDGLYFYRARYYHPVFGRFVSEDPLGLSAGSPSLYEYVRGDPASITDPSGKIVPWLAACAASAAFSALIDVGSNMLAGRKNTFGSVIGSAASGCVQGLVGFGIGTLVARIWRARTLGSVLYHYTDDAGAAGIKASGQILPGRTGQVFVSPTRYTSAAQAQAELALPRMPTQVIEMPKSRLPGLTPPSKVKPNFGQPGGGMECWVTCAVDTTNLPFMRLGR
jgi:RHS repeat-associated protein